MPILNLSPKFRFREIILLGSIVVFIVLVIALNFSIILSFVSSVTITLQRPYNFVTRQIGMFVKGFRYASEIVEENNNLKIQNTTLLQENIRLKNLSDENKRLLEILNYTKNNPDSQYQLAYIYAQDTLNVSSIIFLDKGTNQQVKVGNHLIYNGLYLGKIIEV